MTVFPIIFVLFILFLLYKTKRAPPLCEKFSDASSTTTTPSATPLTMAESSDNIAAHQSRQSTPPEASSRPVTRSQARQGLTADTPISTERNNTSQKEKDAAAPTVPLTAGTATIAATKQPTKQTTKQTTKTPTMTLSALTSDKERDNNNNAHNKYSTTKNTTARGPSSKSINEDFQNICAELLTPGSAKTAATVKRLAAAFAAFGAAMREEGIEEGRKEEQQRQAHELGAVERMADKLEKMEAAITKITTLPATTETTRTTTWAAVASGGAVAPNVIPARNTREVHVFAPDAAPDIANRTALQTVQAVNTASGTSTAIAARTLPSGRVAITFTDPVEAAARVDGSWVRQAFGPTARAMRPQTAVFAKGLPARALRSAGDITGDLQRLNTVRISKIKVEMPKMPEGQRANVILHVDPEAAQLLCRYGLIWNAGNYTCEPFHAMARARRCYNCHSFDHISRSCTKAARCGHCAGAAHNKETDCPQYAPQAAKRCVNCNGRHPAWARECPEAIRHRQRAAEAYQSRPKEIEILGWTSTQPRPPTPAQPQHSTTQSSPQRAPAPTTTPHEDNDGFTPVQRTKRRGRPPRIQRPEGANGNIRAYMHGNSTPSNN